MFVFKKKTMTLSIQNTCSRIYLVYVLLFYCVNAHCQLNESDTTAWQLKAGTTGFLQQGNVTFLAIKAKVEILSNGTKTWVFKSQNNNLYQEFGNRKADNDLNSQNYLYYKPRKTFYPFAMTYLQTNFRRKINYRWFGGIGATWQFVNKTAGKMKLSAAVIKEVTDYRVNNFNESYYNGSDRINLYRATIYLAGWHKFFENLLKFYYTAYWQPGFDAVSNNRYQLDMGIDLPARNGLNVTVQYNLSYEAIVADKIFQTDRILSFGFNYLFQRK
jgi:hypothetical protein